jgi:hypothetical protein
LTQMRLSRENLDSHTTINHEDYPLFGKTMLGDLRAKGATYDTECMSEHSSRSSVGGPAQTSSQMPILKPTSKSVPTTIYSSHAKQQEQRIQGGLSSTTTAYIDPVPIHSVVQPVPVSLSNRSMRVGPPNPVSCPSTLIENTNVVINPESLSSSMDAPLSKYGSMGFRKSLLKFLDSDSDLSDLDISRHSKGGSLDVSTHSLTRSNNGNRLSSPPCSDPSDGIQDINVEPRAYLKSQGPNLSAFHRQFPLQLHIQTFNNRSKLSSQSEFEDPLDVCRHGDIKP